MAIYIRIEVVSQMWYRPTFCEYELSTRPRYWYDTWYLYPCQCIPSTLSLPHHNVTVPWWTRPKKRRCLRVRARPCILLWVMWSELQKKQKRRKESWAKRWSGEREAEVTGINVRTQSTHTGIGGASLTSITPLPLSAFFPLFGLNWGETLDFLLVINKVFIYLSIDLQERLAPRAPHHPSTTSTTTSACLRSIQWVVAVTLAARLCFLRSWDRCVCRCLFFFIPPSCAPRYVSAAGAASPWGFDEEG